MKTSSPPCTCNCQYLLQFFSSANSLDFFSPTINTFPDLQFIFFFYQFFNSIHFSLLLLYTLHPSPINKLSFKEKPPSLSPLSSIPYIMALDVPPKHQHSHSSLGDDHGCGGCARNDYTPITSTCVPSFDLSLSHHLQHHHQPSPITLDLFRCEVPSSTVELDEPSPLPFGWQKFLNIKTGEIYYTQNKQLVEEMSNRNNGKSPKLDLKLNLSPPRANINQLHVVDSPNRSLTSTPTSPPSSCVSSELNNNDDQVLRYSNSPEATSMVLVGCPRCLMYVMLSEEDPKCPKCKSSVLLDFLNENHTKKSSRKPN